MKISGDIINIFLSKPKKCWTENLYDHNAMSSIEIFTNKGAFASVRSRTTGANTISNTQWVPENIKIFHHSPYNNTSSGFDLHAIKKERKKYLSRVTCVSIASL